MTPEYPLINTPGNPGLRPRVGGAQLRYSGAFDCFFKVLRQEGWRSLYAGMRVTILRGVPNTGIQFCVYEACKDFTVAEERRRRL